MIVSEAGGRNKCQSAVKSRIEGPERVKRLESGTRMEGRSLYGRRWESSAVNAGRSQMAREREREKERERESKNRTGSISARPRSQKPYRLL